MCELADMLDMMQLLVYDTNGEFLEPSMLSMICILNAVERRMRKYIHQFLNDMITPQIILYVQISFAILIIHCIEFYIIFSLVNNILCQLQ